MVVARGSVQDAMSLEGVSPLLEHVIRASKLSSNSTEWARRVASDDHRVLGRREWAALGPINADQSSPPRLRLNTRSPFAYGSRHEFRQHVVAQVLHQPAVRRAPLTAPLHGLARKLEQ